MAFINHYSMVWSGILVLGLGAFFILRKGITIKNGLIWLAIGIFILVGWIVLRPDQATTTELSQFQGNLGRNRAVLLELQSPY